MDVYKLVKNHNFKRMAGGSSFLSAVFFCMNSTPVNWSNAALCQIVIAFAEMLIAKKTS